MLWAYNFLTSIVLVNLLIAQMGARYEVMQDIGFNVWLGERIELIKEFKDERDPLPAPLNLIQLLLVDIPRMVMKRLGGKSSDAPGLRGGFKLELRGASIGHARQAVKALCD